MLENFQVIELSKKAAVTGEKPATLIIERRRLRFTMPCITLLNYAGFVRYLIDPKGKRFAVQVGKGNESNTTKFSKAKGEQKVSITYQNGDMMELLWGLMKEWDEDSKYQVDGEYLAAEKSIVFDLKAAQRYQRFSTSRKKEGLPEE